MYLKIKKHQYQDRIQIISAQHQHSGLENVYDFLDFPLIKTFYIISKHFLTILKAMPMKPDEMKVESSFSCKFIFDVKVYLFGTNKTTSLEMAKLII